MITFPITDLDLVPYGGQNIIYANLPNSAGLANATLTVLTTTPGPLPLSTFAAEALYADACSNASTTPDNWKVIAHQLFGLAATMPWQDYGTTDRAANCQIELRRQLGDPSVTANASVRPAVLDQFNLDPVVPVIPQNMVPPVPQNTANSSTS